MSMLTLDLPSGRERHTSLWARFCNFIEKSNRIKADEVIRQHCHLLPHEMEALGRRLDARSEKSIGHRAERYF